MVEHAMTLLADNILRLKKGSIKYCVNTYKMAHFYHTYVGVIHSPIKLSVMKSLIFIVDE